MMKTAVCVGNGTWLPQVSCGADGCTVGTDGGGKYNWMQLTCACTHNYGLLYHKTCTTFFYLWLRTT